MDNQSGNDVITTRVIDAPLEAVWKSWSVADLIKKWWGPKDFTAPHIESDFRVGGKFLFCMNGSAGEGAPKKDYWNGGVYEEIIPMKKIVCMVYFSDETGNPVTAAQQGLPGNWPMETKQEITFEDLQGKTSVTIREIGIPNEMKEMSHMGWMQSLDKLTESLN